MMFNGIEIVIGSLGALIGIGGGYLVLSAFFAGIRHITKPGAVEVKETTQEKQLFGRVGNTEKV